MTRKVKRDTLSDQVAQGLMAFIDEHDLMPGQSLPSENQLAQEFGVSRPVIREALRTLQGEGIIEIITGKNAVIKPISSRILRKFFERSIILRSASFQDLIEVRRGLEIQSVMLAAQRCTPADIEQMQTVITHMRDNVKSHETFAEYDVQFHLLIAAAARNSIIYHLIESIREAMRENILQGMKHRFANEDYDQVQCRHEAILEALRHRNPEQARYAMQQHFDEALKAILYEDE